MINAQTDNQRLSVNGAGVIAALYESCDKFSDQIAIDAGYKQISYEELDVRANQIANSLLVCGLTKGSIVAVILDDRVQIVTALLGILRAGCVFVPLDVHGPQTRLRTMIENLAPDCFVVGPAFWSNLGSATEIFGYHADRSPILTLGDSSAVVHADMSETDLESFSIQRPSVAHGPDDPCYIYHTSGSTGVPKGIVGRLKSLSHFIKWELDTFSISCGIRVSQLISPTFDAFLRDVLVPLTIGGTLCIPADQSVILDPTRLIRWLDDNQINLIHCVPFLFNAIVHERPDSNRFAALNYILMSGESLQVSDISRWIDIFGERVTLVNLFGATESTMIKFYHVIARSDLQRGFIPIGNPMQGARAVIIDDKGNLCAPGMVGELYIRTPYLTLGYYKNPEATAAVFVANPLTGDATDIVYKTGDLARLLSDGTFQFVGRRDGLVKVRGNRVEIGEIESALKTYPGLKNAVVTVAEDVPGGRLVAFFVPDPEATVDTNELWRFLGQRLPDYMIPSSFVELEQLPLTSTGKVDRLALVVPELSKGSEKGFVAPRNTTEELVANIWSEVLSVPSVGVFDNFFHLGGHSLKATQVMARINSMFELKLPLRLLFETSDVAGLATYIEQSLIDELEEMPEPEAAHLAEISESS